ncbi:MULTISPECIES: hypothetical protein [Flavobacterium]|uniref:hypothetical protein n=1 Tax=Flavobacterium TaxID=237 RepID=UPI001FCC841E|nr:MULTISPECIES: hypothetical protein [Flavobacterium]UOK42295.1 hypothetical protein LZF87_13390 [Flavobacterium enshiense]
MKQVKVLSVLAISALLFVSCSKEEPVSSEFDENSKNSIEQLTGNGAPSGAHYNLNIIGVKNPKTFNYDEYNQSNTQGNGRRIFVSLIGNTKILLSKGDFDVIDANGTDGIAAFQLPEPDAIDDGVTDYSVFIRTLGKPGGSGSMKSCMDGDGNLATTGDTYCSTGDYIVNLTRTKGQSKFQNVTNQLLYVWADIDGDGDIDRTELFDDDFESYWWDYENEGLKLVQMRFYPGVETPVWDDPEPTRVN